MNILASVIVGLGVILTPATITTCRTDVHPVSAGTDAEWSQLADDAHVVRPS